MTDISTSASSPSNISAEERLAKLQRWSDRPDLFCREVLSEWFPTPLAWFQKAIIAIFLRQKNFLLYCTPEEQARIENEIVYRTDPTDENSPTEPIFRFANGTVYANFKQNTLVIMPREFSKTTLTDAAILMMLLFLDKKFPLYVSKSASHSMQQLASIKHELETNPEILKYFGDRTPKKADSERYSRDYIELPIPGRRTPAAAAAKGRESQTRGLLGKGAQRPDIIGVDDFEDDESMRTAEQREKVRQAFFREVMGAASTKAGVQETNIVVLGTELGEDSLLSHLEKDPEWTTVRLCAGGTHINKPLLWPEQRPQSYLDSKLATFERVGDRQGYFMEYQSEYRDDKKSPFRKECFRYGYIEPTEFMAKALCVDPAFGEGRQADYCAFGVVGITKKGIISVLDCTGDIGMPADAQLEEYFRLFAAWSPNICGYEDSGQQRYFAQSLKMAQHEKGIYFVLTPVKHPNKTKPERIMGQLHHPYNTGLIVHRIPFPRLEAQLLNFGRNNTHDDFPDVIAMCLTLLEPYMPLLARFGEAARPAVDTRTVEERLGYDWRVAV